MSEAGTLPEGEGTSPRFIDLVKEILRRIKYHNVMVSAAGIAFYGFLALVPTLIALVSVYGIVADPAEIEQQVTDVAGSLDETTQDFMQGLLEGIVGDVESDATGDDGGVAGLIGRIGSLALGILLALFSASSAVQKLMGTINLAYEEFDQRPGWKVRGLAYLFTTAAIVGIALMVFSIGVIPALLDRIELAGPAETVINVLRLPIMALLFGGALTVLYRYGPDRPRRTPWRNPGAVVAMVLFIVFAIAFSLYFSNVGELPSAYAFLGSIAALLIFLQLTAISVIIGAEVNGAVEDGPMPSKVADPATVGDVGAGVGALEGASETGGSTSGSTMTPVAAARRRGGGGGGGGGGGSSDSDAAAEQPAGDTLGFGKALAGLVALFVLGRSVIKDD